MMETITPPAELEKSCLAEALPPWRISASVQESNESGKVVDCFYSVRFIIPNDKVTSQTLLVRIRGSNEPKIIADPFLDLYGGRLAAYAAAPTQKPACFHVILSAKPYCPDSIPLSEEKFSVKLLSDDNSREITTAISRKDSNIGKMLDNSQVTGLTWGTAKACTVMLQWNTTESPNIPYLEALEIKTMGWNP